MNQTLYKIILLLIAFLLMTKLSSIVDDNFIFENDFSDKYEEDKLTETALECVKSEYDNAYIINIPQFRNRWSACIEFLSQKKS